MQIVNKDNWPRSGFYNDGPDYDPGLDCSVEPSMTKQSFAAECDINTIMSRYEKTGVMPQGTRMYEFGEAISEYSFHESMNAVKHAEELFAGLSAKIRDRFNNDPAALLRWLDDSANLEEAVDLGIVDRPPDPPAPMEVRIVPDPLAPPQPDGSLGATT